ncbi:MAG: flagellar motor switch protein FliN [Hyphomicrobiales bacterium]|nr:flagellar motor switch protein FliN [Hyphomicrobiales bacterium]
MTSSPSSSNGADDDFPSFAPEPAKPAAARPASPTPAAEAVMRIPVSVKIVLGAAVMPVSRLVSLGRGAVIPLDRKVGEAVDVTVNGHVIARGEIVIVNEQEQRFGVSLTEIVGAAPPYP